MARSMNTYTQALSTGFTNASYVDWASRISAPLRAAVPRTNDNGQVNWSTVTTMPAATVIRDYEVYALSDSLQATKPIYVRVDYGNYNTFPGMQIHVGTSTNGAGILSGIQYGVTPGSAFFVAGSMPICNSAAGVASQRFAYASSDGSYIAFFFNIQSAGVGAAAGSSDSLGGFIVERTRDLDGTPNGNGYMVWRWNAAADVLSSSSTTFTGTTLRVYDTVNVNSYQPASTFDYGAAVPPATATSTLTGTGAQAFPVYGATQAPQGASKALALAYTADFPRIGQVTLTHYGVASQWISLGTAQNANVASLNVSGIGVVRQLSPLFRWE